MTVALELLDPWPARTVDQSSSNHRQVAVLFTLAWGSVGVGAGKMIEAGGGRVNEGGGDTGKRCESHLEISLVCRRCGLTSWDALEGAKLMSSPGPSTTSDSRVLRNESILGSPPFHPPPHHHHPR